MVSREQIHSQSLKVIGVNAATVGLFLLLDTLLPLEKWPLVKDIPNDIVRKGLAPITTLGVTSVVYLWKRDKWYALPVASGGITASVIQLIRKVGELTQKDVTGIEGYYADTDSLPEYTIPQLAGKP